MSRGREKENETNTPNMNKPWTDEEIELFKVYYPLHGKQASMEFFSKSEGSVRKKAWKLGLRQDRTSAFFQDWQSRAALSKIGKKRPEQADVMRQCHAEGKMIHTPERRAATGEHIKKWLAENEHPRGMKGKKHSQATLEQLSVSSKKWWDTATPEAKRSLTVKREKSRAANGTPFNERPAASWKSGWHTIGGKTKYFRSRWESNYARYLEWLKVNKQITEWEHEPETFWFDGVKRGCVSYLPDFRVTNLDNTIEYHEVKGWMDDRSKTKIRRMKKYHPTVKLLVIDAKAYKSLALQMSRVVDGWE